jgi:hypothetical protein
MTRITFIRLEPRIATTVTATTRYGRAKKASVIRIRTASIQPRRTPLTRAMRVPTAPDTNTARKPTVTEILAP